MRAQRPGSDSDSSIFCSVTLNESLPPLWASVSSSDKWACGNHFFLACLTVNIMEAKAFDEHHNILFLLCQRDTAMSGSSVYRATNPP